MEVCDGTVSLRICEVRESSSYLAVATVWRWHWLWA